MDVQILLIPINAGMVNALQVLINALFLLVATLILHHQIVDCVIRHVLLVRFDALMVLVLLLIHVQLLMVVFWINHSDVLMVLVNVIPLMEPLLPLVASLESFVMHFIRTDAQMVLVLLILVYALPIFHAQLGQFVVTI